MASGLGIKEPDYIRSARTEQKSQLRPVLPNRPRGYDNKVIQKDISDGKYKCSDCHYILKEPLQSFCGHRFCTTCLRFLLSSAESQPVLCKACEQEGTLTEFSNLKESQTFPDNGIRREMGGLAAVCINSGCVWKGPFRDYEIHEPKCDYKTIQCDLCGSQLRPQDLESHKRESCPAIPGQCKYCGEQMTGGKLKNHTETCNKLPVKCSGCSKTLLREELLQHSDPDSHQCERPIIPCQLGCAELVEPKLHKEHLVQNLDNHIATLYQQIQQVERDLKDVQMSPPPPSVASSAAAAAPSGNVATSQTEAELRAKIKELEAKIAAIDEKQTLMNRRIESGSSNLTQRVPNATPPVEPLGGAMGGAVGGAVGGIPSVEQGVKMLDQKMLIFERVSAVFKREIEKVGKQVEDLLKTTQENKDRVEAVIRQFQPIERTNAIHKGQIAEIQQRLISSEASSFDGTLLWKMPNFKQRRQEAVSGRVTSFYSSSFFTSRTGYKACARIYLNGDGMGKGTHVSLFFVLMRGDYDALLHWPFQQKVTLIWLDQNKRDNIMDTFRPDPTSSSFKRPTSDMNIASGCPLFMPLSTIDAPNQSYVKDDVGFIKIIIDPAGLE